MEPTTIHSIQEDQGNNPQSELQRLTDEIRGELEKEFEQGGYKLADTHFESGLSLHSKQYYFAKRFFENSHNCKRLARLLYSRLKAMELLNEVTLIGFRNYTGLLLNEVTQIDSRLNYAIIEQSNENNGGYIWQYLPDLKRKLVVVLPTGCTYAAYEKLFEWLSKPSNLQQTDYNHSFLSPEFINVFLILDESLRHREHENITIKEEQTTNPKIFSFYSEFKWNQITNIDINKISFNNPSQTYIANPLIRLYAELYLPDECPLCFPDKNKDYALRLMVEKEKQKEKPLLPTHSNYESPNLIFGFPNFSKVPRQDFFRLFFDAERPWQTHLYGHVTVNNSSYLNYIRGNAFYEKNKKEILDFFLPRINLFVKNSTRSIIFITAENKHNSNFLEDVSVRLRTSDRSIHILRFEAATEFIDNFISLYGNIIHSEDNIVIYFEEVLSGANTLKLVSDHIKHACLSTPNYARKGFDLVLSLVDRTLLYTREEVIRKINIPDNKEETVIDFFRNKLGRLDKIDWKKIANAEGADNKNQLMKLASMVNSLASYSNDQIRQEIPPSEHAEDRFISFFKLNVPIIAASYLGNPLQKRIRDFEIMISQTYLDSLKISIGNKLVRQWPSALPEMDSPSTEIQLKIGEPAEDEEYFPFSDIEKDIEHKIWDLYAPYFDRERQDLLKLYLTHLINTELSRDEYQEPDFFEPYRKDPKQFIQVLIDKLQHICKPELDNYFIDPGKDQSFRKRHLEEGIIHDEIIKLLTRFPFVYYKNIYEAIFDYCSSELDILHDKIEKKGLKSFQDFRNLKFYIKRSVDLNSNFIISERFLSCIKKQVYYRKAVNHIISWYEGLDARLKIFLHSGKVSPVYYTRAQRNISYKKSQVKSYFKWLLYCYKELINQNPNRAIEMEDLVNSISLLPDEITRDENSQEDLQQLLKNPYYHFIGMAKAENLLLFDQLKTIHKNNLRNNKFRVQGDYSGYYLSKGRNHEAAVTRVQKLMDKSRFRHLTDKSERENKLTQIRTSFDNMLKTIKILHDKNKSAKQQSPNNFNSDIKDILNAAIKIIQPGIPEGSLDYAFFIEFAHPSSDDTVDNIYTIVSDEKIDLAAKIRLSREGLVYNLLYGLSDMEGNEQSLVVGARINQYHAASFQEQYVCKKSGNVKSFQDLYEEDCHDSGKDTGLKQFSDAKMCLAIRLAKLKVATSKDDQFEMMGQAVIVITNRLPANMKNYLDFMSNEKVRQLLLIKEELLDYLQGQFENDAFIELRKNEEKINLAKSFQHGIGKYQRAIDYFLSSPDLARHQESLKSIWILFEMQFTHLIESTRQNHYYSQTQKIKFSKEKISEWFRNIMEIPYLARMPLYEHEYTLTVDVDDLECPEAAFYIGFTEIFLNMRKHSLAIKDPIVFSIYRQEDTIIFENRFDPETNPWPLFKKPKGGKEMCRNIFNAIAKMEENLIAETSTFQVKLTFLK